MDDDSFSLAKAMEFQTNYVLNEMSRDIERYEIWKNSRSQCEDTSLSAYEEYKKEQQWLRDQELMELYGYVPNGWNA